MRINKSSLCKSIKNCMHYKLMNSNDCNNDFTIKYIVVHFIQKMLTNKYLGSRPPVT